MERKAIEPLSREAAKARVRAAADGAEALSWVYSHPKEAALAAFIIGVIVGTSPTAREALVSGIVALLKRSRP
jgi:hypothetical protein